ncbi:Isochorismatase-like protein [Gilbertella persicaria]|uniref:Isochorismatase-like protein n=1 Tax=Gilbertella persicaria TaxID=101096 RepID=UPI00221E69A4|nr:Isochorismatase-like protein [Gilbertella persicaria]KAI8098263.1 Isochorismatase-like protein [Gilbertella persicaria]
MKEALVLVDIQNDYFPGGKLRTWQPEETAEQCRIVLDKFREDGKEVVHVVHHMLPEHLAISNFFIPGTPGTEIHESVKPLPEEKVIIKHYSNGFWQSDLKDYLKSKGIEKIVVVGMMIHNCVPATVFAGKDEGFEVVVVDEAVNTLDQPLHGEMIKAEDIKKAYLAGIQFYYAKVKKVQDILDNNY